VQHFGDIAFGPASRRHQQAHGSDEHYAPGRSGPAPDALGVDEVEFLRARDSFYLATVGPTGWPYVQHRGGPPGFIRVVGPTTIAWADRIGNRQYVSAGNLDGDDRVALIAVDYPDRRRLKAYGHARYDEAPDPARLSELGITGRLDALVTVEIVAVDWNCPKHITPRFTEDEVRRAMEPLVREVEELRARVRELET
jgi:uncharacterized protein